MNMSTTNVEKYWSLMNQKVFIQKDEFINRMNEEESSGRGKRSLEVNGKRL